jgi:transposase InsO family protein
MLECRFPEHIRSDNGAEMMARIVRNWFAGLGAKTLYIEPGSPWENGYCESYNGKLRDECLDGEIFFSLVPRPPLTQSDNLPAERGDRFRVPMSLFFGVQVF